MSSLALVVILGLVAVAAIAWLLSPRDLTIDIEALADDRTEPHHHHPRPSA